MTTTLHRIRVLAAAGAATALLGGCAGAQEQDAADSGPSAADASPPGDAPSSPAAPAPPEAADGTDLQACADADCEVLVESGDEFAMDGSHGVDRFVVDAVGEDGLDVSGYGPGTTLSGRLPPPDGEGPGGVFVMNGFEITLVAVTDSGGVVRLAP
ncbi:MULTISPECIES: hypothetical protein [Nocardiopsis]|uniref:Lipoprotein n=1 Tax=Nocardiopsis dassonvillei (strain ATCC 23218 / DSM 43111 / CIP 107115 / JCM 7437 / KCTC 9190 / NBRC 14626 / NCTC 10488 / NRRL B-5397 / IMRU 509) TaxID=446468 RepID=D7B758_NOCDD|nr:hypothetical protein [Nocardiopsis dassonvillei]ADH67430.1 hypothetical protein Ndas_2004 [Nocardiopsis dassonvillei subsp. dassonvillei DSM 43111]NKY77433.1 hypothetical protein [Nocardiopsis dassonvillei]VEI87615.1 Uncharacterised protein [Nocardiopsis dassonvillei]